MLSFFTRKKFLDNIFVNILGSQPARYLLAKIFYSTKKIFSKVPSIEQMNKKGFVLIENFLSDDEYNVINNQYLELIQDKNFAVNYKQEIDKKVDENIKITHVYLDKKTAGKYFEIFNLKNNKKIIDLFRSCELKNNIFIQVYLERIENINNKVIDLQKTFHYDTFHNTFKFFFYLNDVTNENSPFLYVEGSHKFTFRRLFKEWLLSIKYSLKKMSEHKIRDKISVNDKIKTFTLKKNTLVTWNACGLHRRGDSIEGSIRDAIVFYTRENPFKIFFDK